MGKQIALRVLPLVMALVIPAAAMPAYALNAQEAGIAAFEEGDYQKALRHFRQAQRQGVNTPNLCYNLGVTYYRLERYDQAADAFRLLTGNPEWRHLALYNLGLIAEARGDSRKATDYYSRARDAAGESRVGRLAALKLQELRPGEPEPAEPVPGEPEPAPAPDRGYGLISVAAGYDDNVVLAPEEGLEGVSEEGDVFTELYGLAGLFVSGNRNSGVRLDAGAFTRLYASETDYNFSSLSVGVSRLKAYDAWDTSIGFNTSAELTDGELYALVPALELEGERSFGGFELELSNELGWIEGSGEYDYLTGVRNRLAARLERELPGGEIYAGAGLEYNDRKDLSEGGEFFSYSPFRRDVRLGLDYRVAPQWTLVLSGQYRWSRYPDENRMLADGSVIEGEREDDRVRVTVRGEYDMFSPGLIAFGEFIRTDNDSNLSRYSYESNQVVLGLQQVF